MESQKKSGFSCDMEKKNKKKKMEFSSPIQRITSSAISSASEEIPTPEKFAEIPRRAGKRKLSFSIGDVRRVALGLRMARDKSVVDRSDPFGSDFELQGIDRSCSDLAGVSDKRNGDKLSENYEMLAEFFNCLDCSLRLLRLKGVSPTFTKISASIQHLTERRFTYKHLAQIKHILPEAISVKKVILRDEVTCCMKPELQVYLQADAVESRLEVKGGCANSVLRKVFRERLVQFARENPEKDEIPEDTLPHPFGHRKSSMLTESNKLASSVRTESTFVPHPIETFTKVSHFSSSFQRRFSAKTPCSDEMKTPLASLNDVATNVDSLVSSFPSPVKLSSKPPIHMKSLFSSPCKRPLLLHQKQIEEESKMLTSSQNSIPTELVSLESTPIKDIPAYELLSFESTPVKDISACARLMTITPELQTPKRSRNLTIDDTPHKAPVKRATRTKLFPTPRKNVESFDVENLPENSPGEDDVLSFLPKSLLQDIKDKEKKVMEERDANVVGARLRKKMIASLPKLFDSILLIFQSRNRSVITKQELIHQILSCHCSLVDRNEVEEQLKLLEDLVPDWIFRKTLSAGDILYCVNKMSSSQEIRQRLEAAE